jgi:hypothetical protein
VCAVPYSLRLLEKGGPCGSDRPRFVVPAAVKKFAEHGHVGFESEGI